MDQGQQYEFECRFAIALRQADEASIAHGPVVDDVVHDGTDCLAVLVRPEAEKIVAAQFAAELVTKARPGQAESHAKETRTFGNERLPEQSGDLCRFDLEAAWRNPSIADRIPIRVKLFCGRLLHHSLDKFTYETFCAASGHACG